MTLYIPANITNIIFEYYAQMNDHRWATFIDVKTGENKRRVNKYSTKYDNINRLLKDRISNLVDIININVSVVSNNEIIDNYNTIGTSITMYREFIDIYCTPRLTYMEFIDEYNFKYYVFCSPVFASSRSNKYDIYQDGNIYSSLINIRYINKNSCLLVMEKF